MTGLRSRIDRLTRRAGMGAPRRWIVVWEDDEAQETVIETTQGGYSITVPSGAGDDLLAALAPSDRERLGIGPADRILRIVYDHDWRGTDHEHRETS
jgi:hypothetical protein